MQNSELITAANYYRDWLTPSMLLAGLCVMVIIFALSRYHLTKSLWVSVFLGCGSVVSSFVTILYCATRIEETEIFEQGIQGGDGFLFTLIFLSMLFFLTSLNSAIFWRSKPLGVAGFVFSVTILLFTFLWSLFRTAA